MPRIEESLDALACAQWFSTLDLVSGYNQVPGVERDKAKTTFCTFWGFLSLRECHLACVMHQGLSNDSWKEYSVIRACNLSFCILMTLLSSLRLWNSICRDGRRSLVDCKGKY